jgi:thiol-disulfide isomerase/thioredoxin
VTKKFWKRLIAGSGVVVLAAAIAGFAVFKIVEHKVASRLKPPKLQRVSNSAPDLAYRTLQGAVGHVSASKGKVVFVDLWGTWCVQWVAEMPTVQKLYDHYRNDLDVEFLIVSRLDPPLAVRSYAYRNNLDLPFYVTEDEDVPEAMHLNQYPSTFIYARDGSIAAQHAGAANWSDESVIAFIDRLKAE